MVDMAGERGSEPPLGRVVVIGGRHFREAGSRLEYPLAAQQKLSREQPPMPNPRRCGSGALKGHHRSVSFSSSRFTAVDLQGADTGFFPVFRQIRR
jgi:hypothetical protein